MNSPIFPLRSRGFTLMEVLVIVAITMVLVGIGVPVFQTMRQNSHRTTALNQIRQIGALFVNFAAEHDGRLPDEDAPGKDDWANAAKPENANVWYNALPRIAGGRGVADYANAPETFYRKDNLLYLPGAEYPEMGKALAEPVFAFAMNSRIQRKRSSDPAAAKPDVRLSNFKDHSRTVAFLECGIRGEKKALAAQPKYDGSPKANGRAFVTRYGGKGIISFMDGHAGLFKARDVLDQTGQIIYPQTDIIWTPDPLENPNEKAPPASP